MNKKVTAWIVSIGFVLLALLSILAAGRLSAPDTYENTFSSIDSKFQNVLSLAGVTVTASSAITMLPDDVGTPIATQLAEYTDYFLIIVSVLLAEKYLVTIFGAVVFFLLLPAAFLVSIPFFARRHPVLQSIAWKIALMFLALYLVIPVSMKISNVIEDTYQLSIDTALTSVSQLTGSESQTREPEETGLSSLWGKVTDTVTSVTDGISDIPQKAAKAMNDMIQALAVMIVTSCIIPLLVLLLSFYIIKIITGVDMGPRRHPPKPHRAIEAEKEEEPLCV